MRQRNGRLRASEETKDVACTYVPYISSNKKIKGKQLDPSCNKTKLKQSGEKPKYYKTFTSPVN